MRHIRPALVMLLLMSVITGLIYPLAFTALAQTVFPHQAAGSLMTNGGKIIGSELIGQNFASPSYFHGRPSAANYDASNSTPSNLGPTAQKLKDRAAIAAAKLRLENPGAPLPLDLVTTSGSGLDPDISPAAALFQAPRIAKIRGLPLDAVNALVARHIEERLFGILGEPHVNVLKLNLDLDATAVRMHGPMHGEAERRKLRAG
jgi:K+-transporting ATPase ATPase C chain